MVFGALESILHGKQSISPIAPTGRAGWPIHGILAWPPRVLNIRVDQILASNPLTAVKQRCVVAYSASLNGVAVSELHGVVADMPSVDDLMVPRERAREGDLERSKVLDWELVALERRVVLGGFARYHEPIRWHLIAQVDVARDQVVLPVVAQLSRGDAPLRKLHTVMQQAALIASAIDVHVEIAIGQDNVSQTIQVSTIVKRANCGRCVAFAQVGLVQHPAETTFPHGLVDIALEGLFDVLGFEEEILAVGRHVGNHCPLCGRWDHAAGSDYCSIRQFEVVLVAHLESSKDVFQGAIFRTLATFLSANST